MGRRNYSADMFRQLEDSFKLNDKLTKENQSLKLENSLLKDENARLKKELEKKDILADMDCTCSSVPSSKNNFKVGISNNRKPSEKKRGGQKNHKSHYTSIEKIEKEIEDKNLKVIVKKINKSNKNKNEKPIVRYVKDVIIIPVVYKYLIYPNEIGKYDIPNNLNHSVSYGETIQSLVLDFYYNRNVSTDNIKQLSNDLFGYDISKGTIINFQKKLEKKLMPETRNILLNLQKEDYIHVDESQLNIDGELYNIHNASSNKYTMQWIHKNKSHKALEEIGFLVYYKGMLVKDGTHLYDKFAKSDKASCNAHSSRYLIGSNKGIHHNGPDRMLLFLNGLNHHKKSLLRKGINGILEIEYKNIIIQYRKILNDWQIEIKRDKKKNPLYDEERRLCERLLTDEAQHLLFMRSFKIPFTNNRAEVDIRYMKLRMKVGIFREYESAERCATIKSCLSTYRKNAVNVFYAIKRALSSNPVII